MNHPPRRSTSADRPPLQSKRLLDQLRERIRYLHYSLKTEEAYLFWSRAYIRFHGVRHPKETGAVGTAVPLSRGDRGRFALDERDGATHDPAPDSFGAHDRRGGRRAADRAAQQSGVETPLDALLAA